MSITEVYQHSDSSPYRVLYTRPGADIVVNMGHKEQPAPPRPTMRRYATSPARGSTCIVEVEESKSMPTRHKSTTTILKSTRTTDVSTKTSNSDSVVNGTVATVTNAMQARNCLTSSRTGTLYFAFGADISSSHLRSQSDLICSSSSRPIALAKLRGWQWMVSSRGVPNIVQLCEPGLYSDSGLLRSREKDCDAGIVYGLIYNLDSVDEHKVDKTHGYKEHGPINTDLDLMEVSRQPYFQGINTVNKRYERVDIVEWFSDPLKEGVNVVRDPMNVKCLVYVDESLKGLRPGRIWDDEVDRLSASITTAIRNYGIPQRWVENVMSQHGIRIPRGNVQQSNSRSRSRSRVEKETRLDVVKHRNRSSDKHSSPKYDEDDDGSFVETRITKRITEGYEPLPVSEFYREKRGKPTRYRSL